MKTGAAFPSNYIKAADLGDRKAQAVIDHVAIEGVGRQKEQKPVVYFKGKEKGLVLNKTNANKITQIAGTDEMDDWGGVTVILYATTVEFNGEEVDAVRVAAPKPGTTSRPAPPPPPPAPSPAEEFQADDEDVPF